MTHTDVCFMAYVSHILLKLLLLLSLAQDLAEKEAEAATRGKLRLFASQSCATYLLPCKMRADPGSEAGRGGGSS